MVLDTLDVTQKVPGHTGLTQEEHRGSWHHYISANSPFLKWTGGSIPLICLEWVPDLPIAPQDEASLTKKFETWPGGWCPIPNDPDFPVLS